MAGTGLRVPGLAAGHVVMRAVMAVTGHAMTGHLMTGCFGDCAMMRMCGRGICHRPKGAEHQCKTGEHQAEALRQI